MGLTKSAYARHRGVTPAAVTFALRDGRIALLPDGTIDPAEADAMWEANTVRRKNTAQTAAARPGKAIVGAGPNINEERALHERVKRELAEVKLAEERGRLLDRDEVRADVFTVHRALREALRSLPSRLSQQLATETDAGRVAVLLAAEIDAALMTVQRVADAVAPVDEEE